jgi:hypothetical protein
MRKTSDLPLLAQGRYEICPRTHDEPPGASQQKRSHISNVLSEEWETKRVPQPSAELKLFVSFKSNEPLSVQLDIPHIAELKIIEIGF